MDVREIDYSDIEKFVNGVKGIVENFRSKIIEIESGKTKDILEFKIKDIKTKQTLKCQIIKSKSNEDYLKKGNLVEISGKVLEDRIIKGEIKLKLSANSILLIEEFSEEVSTFKNFRSAINKKATLVRDLLQNFKGQEIEINILKKKIHSDIPEDISDGELDEILERLNRECYFILSKKGYVEIV